MSHTPSDRPTSWVHRQPTLLPGRPVAPARLYLGRQIVGRFLNSMAFALFALYVVRDAGLTPVQLIVVGTVLELSVLLFEIPTGVVADLVSRRLSSIIGTVLFGLGPLVMGLFPSFEGILVGQFFYGFGYTFISGAWHAWLADEVGEAEAARLYPISAQWAQGSMIAGVVAGAALGLLGHGLPMVVGGLGYTLIALVLACCMTEAGWHPQRRERGTHVTSMMRIARDGLAEAKRLPVVRAAILVALLMGASSESFDRLWGFHLLENVGVPGDMDEVVLFGAIALASHVGGLGVISIGRRFTADSSPESAARLLGILYLVATAAPFLFAFAPGFGIAVALVALTQWSREAENPFFTMWVNRGLASRTRATVLSGVGQANSLGQVLSGPLFILIAALAGVPIALAAGALLVLPAVVLVRTRPARVPEADAAPEGGSDE